MLSGDSGVAQPVATVLGGAGVLGAGILTFRSAHNTRISAEKTAKAALDHAQTVADDEKTRHEKQLTEQRQQADATRDEQAKASERTHQREVIRDLRSRYTTSAEQLAHESSAIRLAGVYALASLADDWQQQDEPEEKQVAIDLLRAYLRTPNTHTPALNAANLPDTGELEVRKTILFTMHKRSSTRRRASGDKSASKSWNGFNCDLNNADLALVDLAGANLVNAKLARAKLTDANLAGATLVDAILLGADLAGARLFDANLAGARLVGAKLTGANLDGANLTSAKLSGADLTSTDLFHAKLVRANLTGVNLTGVNLTDADLTDADLTDADLTNADLTNICYTVGTVWPQGITPRPSRNSP
ncbi:Secreted effector protein PipB2 [Rhodococcus sp. 66b]|nr:Secreted effector protein PipB2 [Rhodococcus sp. 66b]